MVDLGAVRAAGESELIGCAVGAAVNARDLLGDAEWLSAGVRTREHTHLRHLRWRPPATYVRRPPATSREKLGVGP